MNLVCAAHRYIEHSFMGRVQTDGGLPKQTPKELG